MSKTGAQTYSAVRSLHVNDTHLEIKSDIDKHGRTKICRGREVRELFNYNIELLDPTNGITSLRKRKLSYPLIVAEFLMYICGWGETEEQCNFLCSVVPKYRNYINPKTGLFDGAYGPHIKEGLELVFKELQRDPNSRQCVVPIFTIEDLHNATLGTSVDIPCTTQLSFQTQVDSTGTYLFMTTTIRSNDFFWGYPHDVAAFTLIQRYMASLLGYKLGTYNHFVFNMHYYTDTVVDIESQIVVNDDLSFIQPINFPDGKRELAELLPINLQNFLDYAAGFFKEPQSVRDDYKRDNYYTLDKEVLKYYGSTAIGLWQYITGRARKPNA